MLHDGGQRDLKRRGELAHRCGAAAQVALSCACSDAGSTAAVELLKSTFDKDSASANGGGVYLLTGALEVNGSSFTSDSASAGGGIFNDLGALTLTAASFKSDTPDGCAGLGGC